jgi:hypothetical protein
MTASTTGTDAAAPAAPLSRLQVWRTVFNTANSRWA